MITFLTIALLILSLDFGLYKFFVGKFPGEFHKNAIFIDLRSPQEFAGGSAPNAINIPLATIESNLDKFAGQDQVVLFCRSGNRSGQVKSTLETYGIQNVINGGPWKHVAKNVSKLNYSSL